MKASTLLSTLLLNLLLHAMGTADGPNQAAKSERSGYAEIGGVRLYYEISGHGPPLLYLHGGLSSGRDFRKYIPEFSKHFKVVVPDRRGHGRSCDSNEPYHYSTLADETNQFLDYLKIDSAFVIGWSDGGVVGYHLASRYPSKVRKLIAVGANYRVNGMTPSDIDWIRTEMTAAGVARSYPEVEEEYKKLNPTPENFAVFIAKTRTMWLHDPYISKEEFTRIDVPVLLVAGDRDDIRLDHMAEMHALLRGSQLCILPNTTHFLFDEYSDVVATILIQFLKHEDLR